MLNSIFTISDNEGLHKAMEKFKKERVFDYPIDDVVTFFMEGDGTPYDLQELENVTDWKVIKEKDVDGKRIGTKQWCAHAQIPKALQHVVSPRMLTWYEHSIWDRSARLYKFKIEPFFLKKHVKCQGQTVFESRGPNQCARIFTIQLHVDIPIVGSMFEKLVMEHLKKNEEQDYNLSIKIVREKLGST